MSINGYTFMLKKLFRLAKYLVRYKFNIGYCSCCERRTIFFEFDKWLRDNYKCFHCGSIPRNRALIRTIKLYKPDFYDLLIHESSPGNQSSKHLQRNCIHYSASQFYPNVNPGTYHNGFRNENLENLTFEDSVFDLFVTADVFEHVINPEKAFSEIARVLKPGGLHIFTIPWYPELPQSRRRALLLENGSIEFLFPPVYHGNPVSQDGSLVTFDWGLDFCDFIYESCKMTTTIYKVINRKEGLDGKFMEVFISRKSL